MSLPYALSKRVWFAILFLALTGCAGGLEKKDNKHFTKEQAKWDEAAIAYDDKRWNDSYSRHQKLLETYRSDTNLWFRFGVSAFRVGKIKEAESAFERVLRKSPDHEKALYNLAMINLSKGHNYLKRYISMQNEDQQDPVLRKVVQQLEYFSTQ